MASKFPHLTPCDFYLRGFIKNYVYVPPQLADFPDLRHRIEAAVARITSDTLNNIIDSVILLKVESKEIGIESIILTRLKDFLYTNNIINPNQYGFTNKLSTLHPLLNLTEAISEGFKSKKSTGAVFLDIQKAFDRVWLTGLTYKLINYNIYPPLVFLLHSYNSNRSYQVRVKDTLSTTKFINCGVAQGSLLGPLLFNLYINDIPEYTLTKLNMYADDTAVHTTFKRITSVTFALNKHLKLLEKYYDRWKISINVEKSAAVLFTKKRKIPPPPKMYNTTIPWSQTLRHELRNLHDPENNSNNWLDQSAASYMLAGYNPQSFHIYISDMGWRLASRAICPELSP
ncbi:probable RNA-directed DNA polymerase from transposon X-element [Trichonephila clavipes]|nr:probable RNA-directed DNA polymerase from transposon X-element [Trichonephila clavipes]